MGRSTIKDIAKQAGVSVATVSYVLNNNRTVSAELRNRVVTVINELGYSPNGVARSLRRKHTGIVGIIGQRNSDLFYTELVAGIEDASYKAGYNVMVCNTHLSLEREISYYNLLRTKRVDGIMLVLDNYPLDWIRSFLDDKIPVVRYGYPNMPGLDIDTVQVDNLSIGRTATNHLMDLGHRQIACITPPAGDEVTAQRVAGYEQILEAHGYTYNPALVAKGDFSVEGGYRAAKQLITSGEKFTAVFVSNDESAIGAMHAFKQAGYQIPDDISIIGVDNVLIGSHVDPPLTTVSIPIYDAGKIMFNRLHERLRGTQINGPRDVVLECNLVLRDSCKRVS